MFEVDRWSARPDASLPRETRECAPERGSSWVTHKGLRGATGFSGSMPASKLLPQSIRILRCTLVTDFSKLFGPVPTDATSDPYQLRPEFIAEPPRSLRAICRHLGPGLILTASVVGSGELIATTLLGAENGYTLLWLILVSCVIKVAVQYELGRYCVATGETALEAFNRVPGPRIRVSWVVWLCVVLVVWVMSIWGGMLAGIGEVLNKITPAIPISAWVWSVSAASIALLIGGRYTMVERSSIVMVAMFTFLTIGCAVILFSRPEYFSWKAIWEGLTLQLPQGGIATAITVFGITGVAPLELVIYPYWCLEKGYARFCGPRDDSSGWQTRAAGWLRVMGIDVLNSMVIYSVATAAFYLLGAGVLHGLGQVPSGAQMVQTQSTMFTETLGEWALYPFLAGAVAALYSTLFCGVAALSRVTADFVGMAKFVDTSTYEKRRKAVQVAIVGLLLAPAAAYSFLGEPILMVKIGGVVQGLGLPVLALSTLYLRYRHLPKSLISKFWITLLLWISAAVITVMMLYSVIQQLM